jgi:hypothetical protein
LFSSITDDRFLDILGFFGFHGFLGFLGLLGLLGLLGFFGFPGFLGFPGFPGFHGFFGFLGFLAFYIIVFEFRISQEFRIHGIRTVLGCTDAPPEQKIPGVEHKAINLFGRINDFLC